MAQDVLVVRGYREFVRACGRAESETKAEVRKTFAAVGEAVRSRSAARFAKYDARSAASFRSRATTKGVAVYQSKRKRTGKRGDYGALQMRKALLPARAEKRRETEARFERALDRVCDHFEGAA